MHETQEEMDLASPVSLPDSLKSFLKRDSFSMLTRSKRIGKYKVGKRIGAGAYGTVIQATDCTTLEEVAIKVLKKQRMRGCQDRLKREITAMQLIKHPNAVELKEVLSSKKCIYLVGELVTGGDMFERIEREGPIPYSQAVSYFAQLLDVVAHCHEHGICHRDLKPENILLDGHGHIKVTDFGLSSLELEAKLLDTSCGSSCYTAPEVTTGLGYDGTKADIWSLGCVLFNMLTGDVAFDDLHDTQAFNQRMVDGRFSFSSPQINPVVSDLLSRVLVVSPEERLSIIEIRQLRLFQGENIPRSLSSLTSPRRHSQHQSSHHDCLAPKTMSVFELITSGLGDEISFALDKVPPKQRTVVRYLLMNELCALFAVLEEAVAELPIIGYHIYRSTFKMRVMLPGSLTHGRSTASLVVFEMTPPRHPDPGLYIVELRHVRGPSRNFFKFRDHFISHPLICNLVNDEHSKILSSSYSSIEWD